MCLNAAKPNDEATSLTEELSVEGHAILKANAV